VPIVDQSTLNGIFHHESTDKAGQPFMSKDTKYILTQCLL
jgi:hypothetical protein